MLQPTVSAHSRIVIHDVPVNVIPRRLWDEYEEPEMPDFDVSYIITACQVESRSIFMSDVIVL